MKTIEITVDTKGQTQVATQGFSGSTCRDASRFLEQALGTATDEQLTAEFYASEVNRSVRTEQQ